MAMASTSHVEEAVEEHEEDDGPIPISKLEVSSNLIQIIYNLVLKWLKNTIFFLDLGHLVED